MLSRCSPAKTVHENQIAAR